MSVPDNIRKLTQEVAVSFDAAIDAVSLLIGKGLDVLHGFQREEEAVRDSLRNSLVSSGTLRRKDYDGVMERLMQFQVRREGELKDLIRRMLEEERQLAARLRRSLHAGIFQEVEQIKHELARAVEKAREGIRVFQQEQEWIREGFTTLEARKGEVSFREFKKIIQDLERKVLERSNNHELGRTVDQPGGTDTGIVRRADELPREECARYERPSESLQEGA